MPTNMKLDKFSLNNLITTSYKVFIHDTLQLEIMNSLLRWILFCHDRNPTEKIASKQLHFNDTNKSRKNFQFKS